VSDPLASRGGLKLQAAIDHFDLRGRVRGARAIDVGASTGGFTEVLLREGAAAVTAIEVGHGQMVERLRRDARVKLLERTDFKTLSVHVEPGPFDFFTVDVSFVAARSMLRGLAFRLRPGAQGVVLVKPQFELPRHKVKGGEVSDPALRARALRSFSEKAEKLGFRVREVIDSPVAGGEGTVEMLAWVELVERGAAMPGGDASKTKRAPTGTGTSAGMATAMRWFVVVAPGLEKVAEGEVKGLPGVKKVKAVEGGVEFEGDLEVGMAANLRLRVATRVLVRVGQANAREFSKLRRLVAKLPWERWVPREPRPAVRLQVSASRCRLYHTGAVAETLLAGMGDRLKATLVAAKGRAADDDGNDGPPGAAAADEIRVLARGVEDVWTLSVDSSGELLHRRGWRTEAGAAPLRETLAAGVLALAGYDPARPLLDPMCGAGTIALEAAAWARGQAPGAERRFAFERWPGFDAERWARLRETAPGTAGAPSAPSAPILAWDRDAKAIERVRANAARAGLADALVLAVARLGGTPDVDPPEVLAQLRAATGGATGLVVVNPPYGKRLGSPGQAARLVRTLGRTLRVAFPGWRAAVLLPDARWASALGLTEVTSHPLRNGGLRVHLLVGQVGGKAPS
jgi:putative N6-adenine-specific DNA methylase